MDDPNDNGPTVEGRAAEKSAHAGELVPDEHSKFVALFDALKNPALIASDARVLGAMMTLAKGSVCTQTRRRLSAESGVHEASIRRSVDRLTATGFIAAERSRGRKSNSYRLILEASNRSARAPVRSANRSVRARVGARTGAPVGDVGPDEQSMTYGRQPERPCSSSSKASAAAFFPDELAAREAASIAESLGQQIEKKSPQPEQTRPASGVSRKNTQEQPAPEKAPPPPGPAAGLWTEGRKWLTNVCEIKHATASGFLGKFAKEAGGREKAWELLQQAMRDQPADPRSWLLAAARARRKPAGAVPVETRTVEQIDADNAAEARRLGYV